MDGIGDEKITIGFKMKLRGNKYKSESTFKLYDGSVLDGIGEALNTFLKQAGYFRANDFIFMRDVTQEELDALETYLKELREGGG